MRAATAEDVERTRARVQKAAGNVAAMYPVETMRLAGLMAAIHAGTADGRIVRATVEVFATALAGVLAGDAKSVERLEQMRKAGSETASASLHVERACERYLANVDLTKGARSTEDLWHEQTLVADIALHADPAFGSLYEAAEPLNLWAIAKRTPRGAAGLAAWLTIRANAIYPRRRNEGAAAHALRVRGAMSDARGKAQRKASVAARRAREIDDLCSLTKEQLDAREKNRR